MTQKKNKKGWVVRWILVLSFCLVSHAGAHQEEGYDEREPVCLREYPTDPLLFNEIVSPYVGRIIKAHGLEEWKAVLLTNELHRHLGMWSIIGAKMGIRAREILMVPFDELAVVSLCGSKPPFSCTNDGLQVSTGASLGRGTISNTHMGEPEAIFFHKQKRLRLRAKPVLKAEAGGVIKALSDQYGFQSPQYFKELDKVSVKYWLDWDRKKIFDEFLE